MAVRSVLVAPDSFKGTFAAERVALAIARGVAAADLPAEVCPLADGGEGTMDAIRRARGGNIHKVEAHDALGGPLQAAVLLLAGGSAAVLDSASASGLPLIDEERRDPLAASTAGTGELIIGALRLGASDVGVAAGGSATTDGGWGAIESIAQAGGLQGATLTVMCDVQTPFELAARGYAPQKGASPEQVGVLSERLDILATALPRDPRGIPMTGSGGGLAGGLWAAFGAQLVRGTDFVFDAVDLDAALSRTRAVISGEGRLDEQSLEGKLIGGLASRCKTHGVELHVITGQNSLGRERSRRAGIASVLEARTEPELVQAGRRIALELKASRGSLIALEGRCTAAEGDT